MMINCRRLKLLAIILLISLPAKSRDLKPGFDKEEYIAMLKISARQVDTPRFRTVVAAPEGFRLEYRSPVTGLDNRWDLWMNEDGLAVISLRGTTREMASWLSNFYAAMVPASGKVQLEKNFVFEYQLASDPKAAVHAGWLIGTGMMSRGILVKMDSLYKTGIRNFIVTGHSQGGALSYLMTAHLLQLKASGLLPDDIRIKTYSSAAPKPGNLYFAYAYEAATAGGWAYNVVNTADWVPETPVTIQTIKDFNNVNPFVNVLPAIRKQTLGKRIVFKKIYNKLAKGPGRSQKQYQRFLGDKAFSFVRKYLPDYIPPAYVQSTNYVRTGNTIVLVPDEEYHRKFPDNNERVFMHHLFDPYFYLIRKYNPA